MKFVSSICFSLMLGLVRAEYEPNWNSLDSRPLPSWFDEAKVGIFIHWGVFSVPSFGSEWFWHDWASDCVVPGDFFDIPWGQLKYCEQIPSVYTEPAERSAIYASFEVTNYMKENYPPGFSYQEFAKDFTAEFFNASQWANLFAKSGAKYVILTSKHHEGFTLWPSAYSFSWNSKDTGPHRDLVGELGEAVREIGLKYGLYHSLLEWYNPMYLADKANKYKTQTFVDNKMIPEMKELVNNYQPSIIWSDGNWGADDTYFKSTEFLAWLYNEGPNREEVVVNDRWGSGTPCRHGDYLTCHDKYDPGVLQGKKWENAMTLDKFSWGYRRNSKLSDYLTPIQLLTSLTRTVSCGGNLLINVGPTKEGIINPIFEERLTQLGNWLEINGEAIYSSQPWTSQNDSLNSNVWYTCRGKAVYAINLVWPENNTVELASVVDLFSPDTTIMLLGNEGKLEWVLKSSSVEIQLSNKATVKSDTAWVLKIVSPNKI